MKLIILSYDSSTGLLYANNARPAIAQMHGPFEDCDSNAQFIVTACNSHHALVEAMESLLKQVMQQPEIVRGDYTEDTSSAVEAAQKALALARGEVAK